MEEEKGEKIEDFFEVNPVLLKSASVEDGTMFSSPIETKEYIHLQGLCKENQSKKFNSYNIALIGNYGTGKSKMALNLLHKFEKKGIGFYTEISGVTAGQIITNIYRDAHEKLFGLRRLLYHAAKKGFWDRRLLAILSDIVARSPTYKIESPEGTIYLIPEDHLKNISKVLKLEDTEEGIQKAFDITGEIHKNFREAFAGIAEVSEKFGSLEILLPEEKVTALLSAEKAAKHLGVILNTLDRPIIFILDELEKIYKLDPLERVKFLDFIRALIDVNNKFVFIFCFTRFSFDSLIKQHAALYSRIPIIISLKNFNRVQFGQFMTNRFKQALKKDYTLDSIFEKSFFDFLWEITAGNQRSSLFVLDRYLEYSKLFEYKSRYNQGDLITFLELQPDIKGQLLDMLLYDVKERAQSDPKMSVILNILVEDYGGGPTTLTELHSDERCVYDQETLRKTIIEMQEKDIIKVTKIKNELHFIVNMIIPSILSKAEWLDKKKEVFDP